MRIVFLSLILSIATQMAWAQSPALAIGPSKIKNHVSLPYKLSQNQKRHHTWASLDIGYSAIIYISENGNDGAVSTVSAHNAKDLARMAKFACDYFERTVEQSKCTVVATQSPRGHSPKSGSPTLNRAASTAYTKVYVPKQKPGKFGAFAIRGNGGFGYSWGIRSENAAKRRALRACERGLKFKDGMNLMDAIYIEISKKAGMDKCRVIHIHKP